ncbi:MAG: hypothetical protein ACE5E7_01555 [Anaerolineae bacterium]
MNQKPVLALHLSRSEEALPLNTWAAAVTPTTVLVVEDGSLLIACLERLLSNDSNLNVIGCSPGSEAALINTIWQLQPSVLFLSVTSKLTGPCRLLTRLGSYPNLRLVTVNASDNLVSVFTMKQAYISHERELLSAIHPEPGQTFSESSLVETDFNVNGNVSAQAVCSVDLIGGADR